MRISRALVVGWLALSGAACTRETSAPEVVAGPTTEVSGKGPVPCGLREAAQVDGSCASVGPAEPSSGASALFTRSVDGWGLTPTVGERCAAGELALLGTPTCVPVDDCARPFPPPEAEVVVSTRSTDARTVATLEAALLRVSPGGVIALDAGAYGSSNLTRNVTLVGRCARDTTVGDGTHNAIFASSGARVVVRSMTLSSAASPLTVASGASIDAENVVIKNATVGLGANGRDSKITLRHSLIEGLGPKEQSLGAMIAQGGTLLVQDSEIRNVTTGLLSTDPGSLVRLERVSLEVLDGGPTSSGVEASARGKVEIESSYLHSRAVRLAAVHDDVGTLKLGKRAGGTMVIRSSVLSQLGAELTDAPAVAVTYPDSDLELSDVTLRHQALIGVLIEAGALRMSRVAILGADAPASMRCALAGTGEAVVEASALAVPWAQGVAIMLGEDSDLDLRTSLVANVVERAEARSALLLTSATASLADCELASNEDHGIVAIGGSTVAVQRTYIHGTHAPEGAEPAPVSAVLALNATATLEGCALVDNGEGIIAAGGSVLASATSFARHRVALRAMDGMELLEDSTELVPDAISIAACRFEGNELRTSTDTLPELNAPIGTPSRSRK